MKKHIKYIIIALTFIVGLIFIGSNILKVSAEEVTELTIELLGEETIYLIPNSEYVEWGAKAYDPIDGDISEDIVINSSAINNAVEGTYKVSYTITNSSSQSKTVYRNVIVDNFTSEKDYTFYPNYTSSNNVWNKIVETSDGGYIATGTFRVNYNYDYYVQACVRKYDSNMNVLWSNMHYYSSTYRERGLDCLELENFYVFLTYHTSQGYSTIHLYDLNGTLINSKSFKGEFYNLIKTSNNSFVVLSQKSISMAIVSNNTIELEELVLDKEYKNKGGYFYFDETIYYLSIDDTVEKIDIVNKESNSLDFSNVNYMFVSVKNNNVYN